MLCNLELNLLTNRVYYLIFRLLTTAVRYVKTSIQSQYYLYQVAMLIGSLRADRLLF